MLCYIAILLAILRLSQKHIFLHSSLVLKSNESDSEWEEWDEEEPELTLPTKLTRKEKRIRDKELKK